jgi:hypothetical protein
MGAPHWSQKRTVFSELLLHLEQIYISITPYENEYTTPKIKMQPQGAEKAP